MHAADRRIGAIFRFGVSQSAFPLGSLLLAPAANARRWAAHQLCSEIDDFFSWHACLGSALTTQSFAIYTLFNNMVSKLTKYAIAHTDEDFIQTLAHVQ
jgi:hypothetical protein